MSQLTRTRIPWVENPDGTQGFSWNPLGCGCSMKCSFGCYAEKRIAPRLAWRCKKCGRFEPHLHAERLSLPHKRKQSAGIFVCSTADLFDPELPHGATQAVLDAMDAAPWHRYYVLTKRPLIMRAFLRTYRPRRNWWLGVSATTQLQFDLSVELLRSLRSSGRQSDWAILFASLEPLLEPIDIRKNLHLASYGMEGGRDAVCIQEGGLDWVILGALTGNASGVQPEHSWVRSIEAACRHGGVPLWEKDNLRKRFRWGEQLIREIPHA